MMISSRVRVSRYAVTNQRTATSVILVVGFAALSVLTFIGSGSAGVDADRAAATRSGDTVQFSARPTGHARNLHGHQLRPRR